MQRQLQLHMVPDRRSDPDACLQDIWDGWGSYPEKIQNCPVSTFLTAHCVQGLPASHNADPWLHLHHRDNWAIGTETIGHWRSPQTWPLL